MTGSKDISSATLAAAQAPNIRPILFAKVEFDGGDVNLHSGLGNISFGGDTYTGVGKLGEISPVTEGSDLSQSQMNLTLSGLPNDLISVLLNEQYQGRLATIYLGYFGTSESWEDLDTPWEEIDTPWEASPTGGLVDDPMILYRGLVDTADFQQDKEFAITLSVGNRFAAWNTPIIRRYNNANQQARYPGDNGLRSIERTTNKTIVWGGAS